MSENQKTVFRKKALDHISSPEQLTDYLRVTNPGIWVVLAAVILLLAGIFSWAAVGRLETTVEVKVIVQEHMAQIIPSNGETLAQGMTLSVDGQEFSVSSTDPDPYGRMIGMAEINLPDGTYDGVVVTDSTRPIDFLLTSR